MIERKTKSEVAPFASVATVPGEFVSSAIFEAVQGVYRLSARIGEAVRRH